MRMSVVTIIPSHFLLQPSDQFKRTFSAKFSLLGSELGGYPTCRPWRMEPLNLGARQPALYTADISHGGLWVGEGVTEKKGKKACIKKNTQRLG